MTNLYSIIVLVLMFGFSAFATSETLEGDTCTLNIETRSNGLREFKNIYIEFQQNRATELLAITTIFGLNTNHYQALFKQNLVQDYDQYPYDIRGSHEGGDYQISFYTMKSINGETMNGYRHETITFHFDGQKKIASLKAEYSQRWPFPRDLVDGETIVKECRF